MHAIEVMGGVSYALQERSYVQQELEHQARALEEALLTHLKLQKRKGGGAQLNGVLLSALDASGDPTWATDASGRCFLWNTAAARAWGLRREEVLGRTLGGPLTKVDPISAEISVDGPSEDEFQTISHALRNGAGETLAMLGIARRVSARPELRRELESLETSARTSQAMLAVASHELASPVTALKVLLSNTERAADGGRECPEWLRERVHKASVQVDRLVERVETLLDASRIRAGKFELSLERLDLVALAREVVERFSEQAISLGCRLSLRSPREIIGTWDRLRMDQVLTNLIGNALKFGKGAPVQLELDATDGFVRIEVQDQGRGIPLLDQKRIFEPYERADRQKTAGLGLGLWITKEIVSAHDGAISVSSVVGEGSCFTVVLPEV